MKGMRLMFLMLVISLAVAGLWDQVPIIKQISHILLDPSAGAFLNWNINLGMLAVSFLISLITTVINKFAMDHDAMREIKREQKLLKEEMEKYKDHPEKIMEFQKKQLEFLPRTMEVTMRPAMFTFIPFILLIRWFGDYFAILEPVKIYGFLSSNGSFIFPNWIWAYLLPIIFFSIALKKVFKLP